MHSKKIQAQPYKIVKISKSRIRTAQTVETAVNFDRITNNSLLYINLLDHLSTLDQYPTLTG